MIVINPHHLPEKPGVYLFKDKDGRVLYVGKAVNLKRRLVSYRQTKILTPKTRAMLKRAQLLENITVTSELEALLLEAHLIKKHQPFFNNRAKDDKHPLYIKITIADQYPRVFLARKEYERGNVYFGPFPRASTVKYILRLLRGIFPYDTQKTLSPRPCFWNHIGLCNPCPSFIINQPPAVQKKLKADYRKNIHRLLAVLSRQTNTVRQHLLRDMNSLSASQRFEDAGRVRDQIRQLDYITQTPITVGSFLENPNLEQDLRLAEVKSLYQELSPHLRLPPLPRRVECFDASHTAGFQVTVGMATFIDGSADKNLYRRFRIRQGSGDDLASLAEALNRRFSHNDWGYPDLLVIDGGKTQLGRAEQVLRELNLPIPVIGIVKPFDHIIISKQSGYIRIRMGQKSGLHLLQRIRDEAHRFSRAYHIKLRSKVALGH